MLTPGQIDIVLASFNALVNRPRPLIPLLQALAPDGQAPDEPALTEHLRTADQSDPVINRLRYLLVTWDASDGDWTAGSTQNTKQRRECVYEALNVGQSVRAALNDRLPFAPSQPAILISDEFQRWYGHDVRQKQDFYWRHYKEYLLAVRGLEPDAVHKLDENTNLVLERMANPERTDAYQAKGLVVGYVQSGKTANFTGVIAKAIDAGYRLIIVLSGLTDLLRNQTQRRIDMELVGKEQIRSSDDIDPDFDYATDPHWDRFVSYGGRPVDLGGTRIVRLTGAGSAGEFRSLQHGIVSLEIEKRVPNQPLFDPANLSFAGARVLIIKKHPQIIRKLIRDMARIGRQLFAEVPALVIDDESDQASPNTISPKTTGGKRVTATNDRIRDLLKILPRGQYVGYTATPFANVFISTQDAEDLFPKDFILSLPRPTDYVGVSFFHDLEKIFDDDDQTVENSNERAFVRDVPRPKKPTDDRLAEAVDAFVLSGALKLFRIRNGIPIDATHHTMLVHSSSLQADQSAAAKQLRSIWRQSGYDGGAGISRLRDLFESDFSPVSLARGESLPFPPSFEELYGDLAEAIRRIENDEGPVYIVNGSDEANDPDFDLRPVWKILVGGAKLSRGYTVEGLTISYFRRRSTAQDTLLQMGRWYGFRRGYHDLLRLYLGRSEPLDKKGKKTLDLYQAFEAICRDEDAFRLQLARYALPTDGSKPVTPKEVPPIVFNSHPQLRPAPANKMFNAQLVAANFGGQWIERTGLTKRDAEHNADLFKTLLAARLPVTEKFSARVDGVGETPLFEAFSLVAPHQEIMEVLRGMRWTTSDLLRLELGYLNGEMGDPAVDDWVVIMPQVKNPKRRWEAGKTKFACVERKWIDTPTGGRFLAFSDPKHRLVAECVTGVHKICKLSSSADHLRKPRRGVVLLYPTKKKYLLVDPESTFMGIAVLPPSGTVSTLEKFMVRQTAHPDAVIVNVQSRATKTPRKTAKSTKSR
ncbi:Z1 domain-containing protein [Bradyrhizobium sp. AUGA SZCCT0240]|uniref:Z1 domain-containing protein n=1 Tax=Bradyrhizobium sp. AUGA SZCCT0240 TaxID=2807669 RepID=UPI001BA6C065|nr:Z1 domain-containing protein [Bradyrhizobium sp. AUGA SZCCT0240]MBR1252281.1 Z1 domain-containing protein [Bradyrhizobium sp. AUGA SZCCT0240]